jgi:hypothetical protein
MPTADSPKYAIELERKILRSLCVTGIGSADWNRLAGRLASHRWAAPEHQIVFDALWAIRSQDATTRREQLPAQATRMGFPDVDWENYLGVSRSGHAEIEQLIGDLEALKPSQRPDSAN